MFLTRVIWKQVAEPCREMMVLYARKYSQICQFRQLCSFVLAQDVYYMLTLYHRTPYLPTTLSLLPIQFLYHLQSVAE